MAKLGEVTLVKVKDVVKLATNEEFGQHGWYFRKYEDAILKANSLVNKEVKNNGIEPKKSEIDGRIHT
jgi:hypothetical protein